MLNREYEGQNCSIASTLELIGDRWTILVLREAFMRTRRFEDFQRNTGAPRPILADRLQLLCDHDVLERHPYGNHPDRYEYRLTEKGRDPLVDPVALLTWGDRWMPDRDGPPVVLRHKDCGGLLDDHLMCDRCGQPLSARDVAPREGPGGRRQPPRPARHPV